MNDLYKCAGKLKSLLIMIMLLSSCSLLKPNPNRKDATPLTELKPFTTDYCSEWPNGQQTNPRQWADCCFIHDLHYWVGGTQNERVQADKELKECVKISGSSLNSFLMYIGVRFGGRPGDAAFSWGYGWTKSREYLKLSIEDIKVAKDLLETSAYNTTKEKNLIQNFEVVLDKKNSSP